MKVALVEEEPEVKTREVLEQPEVVEEVMVKRTKRLRHLSLQMQMP